MGFDLNQFAKPIAEVATHCGPLYVYQPSAKTNDEYRRLAGAPVNQRVFETLTRMVSQHVREKLGDEIVTPPSDVLPSLNESEIADLGEAFRANRERRSLPKGGLPKIPPRDEDEAALDFVDRVLRVHFEEESQAIKEQHAKLMDALKSPLDQLLEPLNLSRNRLGSTFERYDRLVATPYIPPQRDLVGEIARATEGARQQDRQLLQLTADMSRQSAEMLERLVGFSSDVLARFDARDQEAKARDAETRSQFTLQVRIAVGSLVVATVVSVAELYFGAKAYYQDERKNAADDASAPL
jgi:hypothetical protein